MMLSDFAASAQKCGWTDCHQGYKFLRFEAYQAAEQTLSECCGFNKNMRKVLDPLIFGDFGEPMKRCQNC